MKNAIIALGLTLAASTTAFAQGSALDAVLLPQETAASNAQAPLSNYDGSNELTSHARLGDGTPVFAAPLAGSVDYTATASIGGSDYAISNTGPRLGDGILPY